MSKAEDIAAKKLKVLEYYRTLPVFKYAAAHAKISEDTLMNWRKDDAEFSDNINQAASDFYKLKARGLRPEFMVERLDREVWGPPKQEIELINPVKDILEGFGITTKTTTTSGTPLT